MTMFCFTAWSVYLIPVNSFHQMSVLLGEQHTPSPGSLKQIHASTLNHILMNVTQVNTRLNTVSGHTDFFPWRTHIYVHPELVFLTDVSYVVQWVKGTLNCGP